MLTFSPGRASPVIEETIAVTPILNCVFEVISPDGVFKVTYPFSVSVGTITCISVLDCERKLLPVTLALVKSISVTLSRLFPKKRIVSPGWAPVGPKLSNSVADDVGLSLSFLHPKKEREATIIVTIKKRRLKIIFILNIVRL